MISISDLLDNVCQTMYQSSLERKAVYHLKERENGDRINCLSRIGFSSKIIFSIFVGT